MGMEPSAALAYGIDLGEDEDRDHDFLGEDHDGIEDWLFDDDVREASIEWIQYGFGGDILAMKDYVHEVGYSGAAAEISSLSVDPAKEEAFKALLVDAGIKDPKPRWILSYHVSY